MAQADPQTAMDEQVVENPDLERVLEDRERAKGAAAEAKKKVKTLDDMAKGKIEEFDLKEGEVARVGRFRIEKKRVEPKDVSFSTEPSSRLWIKPVIDE